MPTSVYGLPHVFAETLDAPDLTLDGGTTTIGSGEINLLDGANGVSANTFSFGANLTTTGNFMRANGEPSAADVASGVLSKHVTRGGSIEEMYFLHDGDLSTNNATLKIHVNGAVQATLTASGGSGTSDVFTGLGISVSNGDRVEIEFDAGSTNPGDSIAQVLVQ